MQCAPATDALRVKIREDAVVRDKAAYPFFTFPPAVRKVIYTTNAIESINARLRKSIKTRGHFPSDDAASNRDHRLPPVDSETNAASVLICASVSLSS